VTLLSNSEKIERKENKNQKDKENKEGEKSYYEKMIEEKCIQNKKRNNQRNNNINTFLKKFYLVKDTINNQKRKKSERKC